MPAIQVIIMILMLILILSELKLILFLIRKKPAYKKRPRRKNMNAKELYTLKKLKEYFAVHNLQDWDFLISKQLTSSGGNCCYQKKLIKISSGYINCKKVKRKDIDDVILHEITHSLGFRRHDKKFKEKLLSIGGNGKTHHRFKW